MTTPTVYARVDRELKEAVDSFAERRGMSLASAVTDLLVRGLEAASSEESVSALEARAQQLQAELSQVRQAAVVMDGRFRQVLGTCECGGALTGRDFLVTGNCPKCGRGVTALLTATAGPTDRVDRNELAPFLAGVCAAAALVVLLYAASQA
ncbi:MAG: hypothetical protein M0010_14050 [Actinomycetota bacterium]|nr:hypothetical protein [Actinomycetota bacterium]